MSSVPDRIRDFTGLTVDEVSDAVLTDLVDRAWQRVRNITGKEWVFGETGYITAEEATINFAAAAVWRRAGSPDKAADIEREGMNRLRELGGRYATGPYTR